MALLLSIDTAGETAIVGLSNEKGVLASESNTDQKNHASFLQPALQRLLKTTDLSFDSIDSVVVVNGPGSYTGLRVGLASAKGICYALNKPLIVLNTLKVMASAAIEYFADSKALYCPLIDARRNEVFTAIYDFELNTLLSPQPVILKDDSFGMFLDKYNIFFFGSGHKKCGDIISHKNAVFKDISYLIHNINVLAQKVYMTREFADVIYTEPFYTKDFFSPANKSN